MEVILSLVGGIGHNVLKAVIREIELSETGKSVVAFDVRIVVIS